MSYLCTFDFVCVVETFVEDFQSDVFVGYNVFWNQPLDSQERADVLVKWYVSWKKVFAPYNRKLDVECGNFILLIIDKSVFGLNCSGELRTQKLKSHLVRTQSLNILPLKPGVGQYIVIHATLTARDFFLAYYPSGPFTCIFPKPLMIFSCVGCG